MPIRTQCPRPCASGTAGYFFFFQAEDGIRDSSVTGVQTCALPICVQLRLKDAADDEIKRACDILQPIAQRRGAAFLLNDRPDLAAQAGCDGVHVGRSEERRVGKECRSRWSPYH